MDGFKGYEEVLEAEEEQILIGARLALACSTPLHSILFYSTSLHTILLCNMAKDTKSSLVNLRAREGDSHIGRQYVSITRLLKGKI